MTKTLTHLNAGERYDFARSSKVQGRLDVQHDLAGDPETDVRVALASNMGVEIEVQHRLARDARTRVRWNLARFVVDPQVQRGLAQDTSEVRRGLAWSRTLEPCVALALAGDDEPEVRLVLAKNSAVALSSAFPVRFLEESCRGRALISHVLASAQLDPEVATALRGSWSGTLDELVETAKEFQV